MHKRRYPVWYYRGPKHVDELDKAAMIYDNGAPDYWTCDKCGMGNTTEHCVHCQSVKPLKG